MDFIQVDFFRGLAKNTLHEQMLVGLRHTTVVWQPTVEVEKVV